MGADFRPEGIDFRPEGQILGPMRQILGLMVQILGLRGQILSLRVQILGLRANFRSEGTNFRLLRASFLPNEVEGGGGNVHTHAFHNNLQPLRIYFHSWHICCQPTAETHGQSSLS